MNLKILDHHGGPGSFPLLCCGSCGHYFACYDVFHCTVQWADMKLTVTKKKITDLSFSLHEFTEIQMMA